MIATWHYWQHSLQVIHFLQFTLHFTCSRHNTLLLRSLWMAGKNSVKWSFSFETVVFVLLCSFWTDQAVWRNCFLEFYNCYTLLYQAPDPQLKICQKSICACWTCAQFHPFYDKKDTYTYNLVFAFLVLHFVNEIQAPSVHYAAFLCAH